MRFQHWSHFLYDAKGKATEMLRDRISYLYHSQFKAKANLDYCTKEVEAEETSFADWLSTDWDKGDQYQAKLKAIEYNGADHFNTTPAVRTSYDSGWKLWLRSDTNAPAIFLQWIAQPTSNGRARKAPSFRVIQDTDQAGHPVLIVCFDCMLAEQVEDCKHFIQTNL